MQRIYFGCLSVLLAALFWSTPAVAQSAWQDEERKSAALKWEMSYLALNVIDAAQAVDCLHRDICQEGNPLLGKHPSVRTLILGKIGFGLVHFAVFSHMNDRNPKAALRFAQVSCVVQGGVVLLNARITFK